MLIRIDSFSIRLINSLVFSSPITAPCLCSSAKPRIAASGVRSSWDASATNLRSFDSLSTRTVNDSSIRPSMVLREAVSRPTSVSGLAAGRRADKSPAAIASAVSSTVSSGLSPIAIIQRETKAIAKSAITPSTKNKNLSWLKVLSTSSSELATITIPIPVGKTWARALMSGLPSSPSIVNGLFLYLAT